MACVGMDARLKGCVQRGARLGVGKGMQVNWVRVHNYKRGQVLGGVHNYKSWVIGGSIANTTFMEMGWEG